MKFTSGIIAFSALFFVAGASAEKFDTADGESLFYQKFGDGPRVVVVASHAYTFPALADLADERWTLIGYDPRSRGQSSFVDDTSALGIDQDVEDLDALRAHLGTEKIDLVGFSFAGRIVTSYAAEHPEHVDRLALLAPAPVSFGEEYAKSEWARQPLPPEFGVRFSQVYALRDWDQHAVDPQAYCYEERSLWPLAWASTRERQSDLLAFSLRLCRDEYVNEWPVYFDRYRSAVQESRTSLSPEAVFERIESPTLLIHGTDDRNSPIGGSRLWAWRLNDARLVELVGQAHALHLEEPAVVVRILKVFLSGDWPDNATVIRTSPLARDPTVKQDP